MLRHSCLDGVGRRIHTYLYAAWMPDEAVWQIGGDKISPSWTWRNILEHQRNIQEGEHNQFNQWTRDNEYPKRMVNSSSAVFFGFVVVLGQKDFGELCGALQAVEGNKGRIPHGPSTASQGRSI